MRKEEQEGGKLDNHCLIKKEIWVLIQIRYKSSEF